MGTGGALGSASLPSFPEDHSSACCPCCIGLDLDLHSAQPLRADIMSARSSELGNSVSAWNGAPPPQGPPPASPGPRCFQGTFPTVSDLVLCWRRLFQPQMMVYASLSSALSSGLIYLIFQTYVLSPLQTRVPHPPAPNSQH